MKMDSVQQFIRECLGNQVETLFESVLNTCIEAGVENFEDLQYVDPEKDFLGILKPIQARKFKAKIDEAFSSHVNTIKCSNSSLLELSPSSSGNPTAFPLESSLENSILNQQPATSNSLGFKVPYSKFPQSALSKLEKNERPTPAERRQIIRIIVAELIETNPAPRKIHLEPIASEVVGKYPRSFSDYIGDTVIGGGFSSLLCQLIARVENCRRGSSTQLKRSLDSDDQISRSKRVSVTAKYGCIDHQPNFPEGESQDSLMVKRNTLINEFKGEMRNANLVDSLMEVTYALQRLDINENQTIRIIKENWPFLFLRKYMLRHAEKLVGFPVAAKFEEAVRDKIPQLFSFFGSAAVKNVNVADEDYQHLKYVPALAAYFKEDCNVIFKIFEENKSLNEVQAEAPATPFIACIGNPYGLDPVCTVFVENVPMEPMIPLNDALHTWFLSFYLFNLCYPEECCATLEFIQRALLSINPSDKGTKMGKRYGKRVSIHPGVLKLLNKLRDYNSPWQL